MDFNEKGFLGEAIESHRKDIEIVFRDFFDAFEDLNCCILETQQRFEIRTNDEQGFYAGGLFAKLHQSCQSVIILARYGLVAEAKIILRSAIEVLFYLKAICDDRAFLADYKAAENDRMLTFLQGLDAVPPSSGFSHSKNDPKTLAKIKGLKNAPRKRIHAEELARKTGLHDLYVFCFRHFSSITHPSIRSIADHLPGQTLQRSYFWGPTEEHLDFVLVEAFHFALVGFACFVDLLDLECNDQVLRLKERFKQIGNLLNKHWAPLYIAASKGDVDTVQEMISAGRDAAVADSKGRTALTVALQNNHTRVVELLRQA